MKIGVATVEISWITYIFLAIVLLSQWQLSFNMAAKRLALERKTIRTKFEDLHDSYAESQTK